MIIKYFCALFLYRVDKSHFYYILKYKDILFTFAHLTYKRSCFFKFFMKFKRIDRLLSYKQNITRFLNIKAEQILIFFKINFF